MRFPVVMLAALCALVALGISANGAVGVGSCSNEIMGTAKPDELKGTAASDRMLGLEDGDLIQGEAGGDCIDGGSGSDQIEGGSGDDRLLGGVGNDIASGGGDADDVQGQAGNDTLSGGAGPDRISAGKGNDTINEIGDGYRKGETIDAGSNRIDAGPGRDTIDAANGRRDRIDCGTKKDSVTADRIDSLKGCERRSFLVSPFPQVAPAAGNRGRSFMVSFRTLATTEKKTEFFSIDVRGPSSKCSEIVSNSNGVTYHRNRVVRYQLRPFAGKGRPAKRWCRGRYRGRVDFVQIVSAGCRITSDKLPDPDCTDSTRIGEFSFRVR